MARIDLAQKLQSAYALHQKGKVAEAAELYRQVVAGDGKNLYALHFLGLIEASAGNFETAKDLMGRSLAIGCPSAEFLENYAGVLVRLGDYAAALRICDKGGNQTGSSNALQYLRAVSLLKLGRFQESVSQFNRVIERQPNHLPALTERSIALVELNDYDAAAASVRKALGINPNYADAHLNLANVCALQQRYDEALAEYSKALALAPRLADAYIGRGNVFYDLNDYDQALSNYDAALALAPKHADALHRKAQALLELGRFSEANESIERAIDLQPRAGRFYNTLTLYNKLSPGDPRLAAMEALAQEASSLTDENQIFLNFALAKALQDVGDYARSFGHLSAGNALKRKQLRYDEPATLDYLQRMRETFSADLLRARSGRGDPSPVPVFIVGMPRSGSTLVEQILASHPQVFGAGETAEWHRAMTELGAPVADMRHAPEALQRISYEDLAQLGAKYLARIRGLAPSAERITNKTLLNFSGVGLIHLALPNARIIHTRRDPVDTCLSCFLRAFKEHLSFTYDLGELGRYYRAYQDLMEHWRNVLPKDVMIEVQYEETVTDLEAQARRIIAHCGLEWDPRCLNFYETERPVRTASLAQVRQPIFQDAVGRWRAYERFLQPLLQELGV
jgi:tetratricopeptide (TPR) repeat protein